jgi:hypothetical protein
MSGPVDGLSVGTIAGDGNCLFGRFSSFVVFQIIQNNVGLHINRGEYKMYMKKWKVWL